MPKTRRNRKLRGGKVLQAPPAPIVIGDLLEPPLKKNSSVKSPPKKVKSPPKKKSPSKKAKVTGRRRTRTRKNKKSQPHHNLTKLINNELKLKGLPRSRITKSDIDNQLKKVVTEMTKKSSKLKETDAGFFMRELRSVYRNQSGGLPKRRRTRNQPT